MTQTNTSKAIKLGVTNLSFHRVTASLVSHILNDMGFEVERIYSPHEENFSKLKSGEIDMLSSAWLPSSHGIYKASVEEVQPLLELGLHYEPYALWGVPDYVPEALVSEVSDLTKPEVVAKMKSRYSRHQPWCRHYALFDQDDGRIRTNPSRLPFPHRDGRRLLYCI